MIEATSMLKAYAFVTEREEQASYDIHRLVRLVIRNWLEKEGQLEDCVTTVIRRLRETIRLPKHKNRQTGACLEDCTPIYEVIRYRMSKSYLSNYFSLIYTYVSS